MQEYININGKSELITNADDLIRVIRNTNYEIADMLEIEIVKALNERELQERKEKSDMIAYESQLDEDRDAFGEILESVEEMESIISSKRMNKSKLTELTSHIRKVVSNVY